MDKFKLLVLDMDGVVNSDQLIHQWFNDKFKELENDDNCYVNDELRLAVRKAFAEQFDHSTELIFPELAKHITTICEKTNCYILWSSSWRRLEKYRKIEDAKDMFNRRGLPGDKLIGYTPQFTRYDDGCRGAEIRSWIMNNELGKVFRAAVVDDRIDAGFLQLKNACFFQTDEYYGITEKHVSDIIKYLNRGIRPTND